MTRMMTNFKYEVVADFAMLTVIGITINNKVLEAQLDRATDFQSVAPS